MTSASRHFTPINFKTRFPALDGIRALAVTMVFALHYGGGTHGGRLLHLLNRLRLYGWAGVDLFFVLSGFLITGILYDTQSDSRFFQRFFARRSIRIFPVFYLVAAVLLLLTPLFKYQWQPGHLPFLVYLGNFALAFDPSLEHVVSSNHPTATAELVHLWSLCVEEQFYLIWPFVVWLIRDRLRLIWIAGGLSLASLALRMIFVLDAAPEKYDRWMMHMLPFRMDSLLIGAILALVLRGPTADRWQRSCKWMFLLATGTVLTICILSPDLTSPWLLTIGVSAIAVAGAGLIGVTLRPASAAFHLFYLWPLRQLGRYSYGFYVYHALWATGWASFVAFLTQKLHSSVLGNGISDITNFAVTFLVAMLSYKLFEVRFLRLKRRFEYDSEAAEHRHAYFGE
jgi:peptidoglycan/LPS O-acetylase OafA/YrhL